MVLPLHQKVEMIRSRFSCSRKEAMQIILQERGQQSLEDPFITAKILGGADKENYANMVGPSSVDHEGCDEVVLQDDEEDVPDADRRSGDARASILAVREDSGTVLAVAPGVGLRDFGFDHVFGEKSRQAEVYDLCAQRLVMDFLNGSNASIISYGQTGSGKTFTMFGPSERATSAEHGIVPRACEEVLQCISDRRSRGLEVHLGMSYIEVFGSEVSDLLREGQVVGQGHDGRYSQVRATDRVGHRYVLDGQTEWKVESWQELQDLLEIGNSAKRLAATAMNERSTRAHAVLVLSLGQVAQSGAEMHSRLFLADLGGSEKISKSKADVGTVAPVTMVGGVEHGRVGWQEYYMRRRRLQETLSINVGLFSLKKVIDALHTRSQESAQGKPPHLLPYVPYQDSKLTMLLQGALGGHSKTLVFCTASMNPSHAVESLQTLRFGEHCSQVKQQAGPDRAAAVQAALSQLSEEIKIVEADIVRKERWETRLVRRRDVDTIAGAFGEGSTVVREEVIPTSVFVGAEKEREHLERLLQRQMDLQGLSGDIGRDFREMGVKVADDGGKGKDFRAQDRFSRKMKARDFEDEAVVAEALRYFFSRAEQASHVFGETEHIRRRHLPGHKMHHGYVHLARWLKTEWENATEAGLEHRSFGKSMMDQTQEWHVSFKQDRSMRNVVLGRLLAEAPPIPEQPSNLEW